MTRKQLAMLAIVADLTDTKGFSPTHAEVASKRGGSRQATRQMLQYLRNAGFVDWIDGDSRTLHITSSGRAKLKRERASAAAA